MAPEIIQLAINQPPDIRRANALLSLSRQLLSLIGRYVGEVSTSKVVAFRQRIEDGRTALETEEDPFAIASLSRQLVADCEAMLDRATTDWVDREAELGDLTNVLREVIDTLRGDARCFEAEFQRSAAAMDRLHEVRDIRELKRQLATEVQALRQSAAARAEAEATQCRVLSDKVQVLEENLKEARSVASKDALTGIPNRGAFDIALREWMARADRTNSSFALAMADLDDFKRINDTHGHPVGDRVIIAAAQLLTGVLEDGDVVTRYGGEEYALLLATPSAHKAKERLTAAIRRIAPAYEYDVGTEKRLVNFTFSAGVTVFEPGDTPESIVKRADEALYEAKRRGKKRVETRTRSFLRALVG